MCVDFDHFFGVIIDITSFARLKRGVRLPVWRRVGLLVSYVK